MKISEIAEKYNIDKNDFEFFIGYEGLTRTGFLYSNVDDELVEDYVNQYIEYSQRVKNKKMGNENQKKLQKEEEKNWIEAKARMLISSGFSFEGYNIVKYSGYISGDDVCEIPRGGIFGNNNGQNLTDALVRIRRRALDELKDAAYDLGCNAIIGVDFDYITLEPETANIVGGTRYEPYIICVTANGNAVVIEKEE